MAKAAPLATGKAHMGVSIKGWVLSRTHTSAFADLRVTSTLKYVASEVYGFDVNHK